MNTPTDSPSKPASPASGPSGASRASPASPASPASTAPAAGPTPAAGCADDPFSDAVRREELHLRRIEMRGFRRSDGLYEIEARLRDTKPFEQELGRAGRVVPAGEPIHDLGMRLVFDSDYTVQAVQAFADAAPYTECPQAGAALQALVGLRMVAGWNKAVRERLANAANCTHLKELLGPIATTAFQSLVSEFPERTEELDASGRPRPIDSCYAYRAEGEVVMRNWPRFHRR